MTDTKRVLKTFLFLNLREILEKDLTRAHFLSVASYVTTLLHTTVVA